MKKSLFKSWKTWENLLLLCAFTWSIYIIDDLLIEPLMQASLAFPSSLSSWLMFLNPIFILPKLLLLL